MDRKTLKQYRSLIKEKELLEKKIDRLYEQLDRVPVVAGKVTKSSDSFPYIEEHMTVQMDEPKEADSIKRRIRMSESRIDLVDKAIIEIEVFISSINDSMDRQIIEMIYLDGIKQRDVADRFNMERSSISKRINKYTDD